jgi:hypothetical protein
MKNINLELTMEQFLALKTVLLYIKDFEKESCDEWVANGNDINHHVYSYAEKIAEALK